MKLFLVSAGHSNADPGATRGKLREADLVLQLRNKVSAYLKKKGVPHLTDGEDGVNFVLKKAIDLEKRTNGVDVEFHLNAGPPTATGTEALSLPNQKFNSQALCMAVNRVLGLKLRGDLGWKAQNSGQHQKLGFCVMGGIILEVGFISNEVDMVRLIADMDKLAEEIAITLMVLNKD